MRDNEGFPPPRLMPRGLWPPTGKHAPLPRHGAQRRGPGFRAEGGDPWPSP